MTRLIDADELKKETTQFGDLYGFNPVWQIIDNAPTVNFTINPDYVTELQNINKELIKQLEETRPKGEWIQTEVIDDDSDYGVNADASECSNCKHIENSHYWTTTYYNFCPNCGADMRKGSTESLDYQRAVEDTEYCERYEPTYNPNDGSM